MKKLMVIILLASISLSVFAIDPPKTGEDWVNMSMNDKTAFISDMLYIFERLDYTMITQYGDSSTPEVYSMRDMFYISSQTSEEVIKFFDEFFDSPMNRSIYVWDVLSNYKVLNTVS